MSIAKHILLATDFSEAAGPAATTAAELARLLDAKLSVLHVHGTPPAAPEAVVPENRVLTSADMDAESMANLERLRNTLLPGLPAVELYAQQDGSAANGICEFAKAHDADLIVVGTHGRSGIGRFLIGSVAEKVVRHAGRPVLTVPHREPPAA